MENRKKRPKGKAKNTKKIVSALLSVHLLGGVMISQPPIHAFASTTAPVVQVISPVNNAQQVIGNIMVLTGNVTDLSSKIYIKYSIGGGTAVLGQTLNGSSSAQNFKVDIPIPQNFSTGTHALKVWAEDSEGEKSLIKDISFEVTTYAPPTLSGSQVNNYAKLQWAIDVLDKDLLYSSSFEDGQVRPSLGWAGTDGGQSFTTEDALTGNTALKVVDTINNGNHYNFPQTSSTKSINGWGRLYFANATPLSITFYAKSTTNGTITPFGDGGWGTSIQDVGSVKVSGDALSGQNKLKVSTLSGLGVGSWITTDTDPAKIQVMYQVRAIDTATNTLTLSTNLTRTMVSGEQVKTRPWRGAFTFAGRGVNVEDGWKKFSINTFVNNYADYDVLTRGGMFYINTVTGGTMYLDDVRFGYASQAFLYRDGQPIYQGYLSEYEDKLAIDKAKPHAVKNVTASVSKQKGSFRWDTATDEGSTYNYSIKAVGRSGEETPMSQPYPMKVTSGVKGYSVVVDKNATTLPDSTIETTTNSFNPTTDVQGSFYVHVATVDNQGNVSDVTHYYYEDGTAPAVEVTSSNPNMTNGDLVLSIKATDTGSGVYRIQLPNGQWVESDNAVYTVSQNGNYTFLVDDHAGNRTTKTVSVQNIDKTAPTISVTPSTTQSTQTPIQLAVTGSDSQSGVSRMRLPDGSWVVGNNATFTAPTNGKYTFTAIDGVGNMGTHTFEITNIANSEYKIYDATPSTNDAVAPTVTLTPSTTSWTSSPVTVQIQGNDAETGVFRIKMPDGSYVYDSKASYTTAVNGTFSFEVEDGMGNKTSKSIAITNIDRTAPTATLTPSTTTWTRSDVLLTFAVSDSQSGVKRIQLPDGSWVTGKTSVTYSVSSNGTYSFNVEDGAGNVTNKTIIVTNIDKQAPDVTSSLNTTEWTNQPVVAFITANDTLSGVKEIVLPNGSVVAQSNVAYTVQANGDYTFIVRDNVGNETSKTIRVSNMDKTAPTLGLSLNTTSLSNNVLVQINAVDQESGIAKVLLPDGKEVPSGIYSYPVPSNGTFEFTAIDKVGNQITKQISVSNVDKTPPVTPTAYADKTTLTNGNVTVFATFSQDSVTKEYRLGANGTWSSYPQAGIVVTDNSIVQFRSFDSAGNSSAIASYDVTNIDKVAPTTPSITSSNLSPTNTSVDISISYSTDSVQKQYRINGSAWMNYSGTFTLNDNGKVEARSFDSVGNVSEVSLFNVTSIDKTPPADAVIQASTSSPTNKDVSMTIHFPSDAQIKQYKLLSEGIWKVYEGTFMLSQNDTVIARSFDQAGNLSNETTLTVSNIDKVKPETAILTADIVSPTNNDVTVTVKYPTDAVKTEVRVNGGSWTSYVSPVIMKDNGMIEARSSDESGNISDVSSYQVNNIDKIAPNTPTLFADKITPTNTNVLVTVNYPADAVVKEVRINNGSWNVYTSPISLSGNGKVEARAKDGVGNTSEIGTYEVANIDKIAPESATLIANKTNPTNMDVVVSATFPSDAVIKQVRMNGGAWTAYTSPVTMSLNGMVEVRSLDEAGNVSAITSYEVNNIDKVAPVTPTLSADKTTPTNTNVVVTASFPNDAFVKEVRINGGSWSIYNAPVAMTDNGKVEVRAYDEAGNISAVASYLVANIDKVAPSSPDYSATANTNMVTASKETDSKTFYRLNGETWVEYDKELRLKDGTHTVEFKAVDQAVNESSVVKVTVSMYADSLNEATISVEKAESVTTQENVNIAFAKVDAMPHDVPEYQPLLKRVNDLQGLLDAQKAIQTAIDSRSETDVKLAQEKISLLNSSNPIILDLMDEIQEGFNEADILALVAKERYDLLSSRYQMTKESYTALVNIYYAIKYTGDFMYTYAKEKVALVPVTDKHYSFVQLQFEELSKDYGQFVQERIQTDAEIKAENSVKTMETKYDPAMAVNTQNLINAVEEPTVRAGLQNRLDTAKAKYEASLLAKVDQDAIIAVEKAEHYRSSFYVTEAYKKVNYLTNAELKFQLTNRLQVLEAQMALDKQVSDAKRSVELAEQYPTTTTYLTSAQTKVSALPDVLAKSEFQARIDKLKAGLDQTKVVKDANSAVSLAQSMKTQYYLDKAKVAISLVLDETVRMDLTKKVEAIVVTK